MHEQSRSVLSSVTNLAGGVEDGNQKQHPQERCMSIFVCAPICGKQLVVVQSKVMAILSSSGFVNSSEGCEGPVGLVLDITNFYAEQGGQVADVGSFASSSGRTFEVQDTQVSNKLLCLPFGLSRVEGLPICVSWYMCLRICVSERL